MSWGLYVRDRASARWYPIWQADGPGAEAVTRARFDRIAMAFAGGAVSIRISESWAAVRLVEHDVAWAERERTYWASDEDTRPDCTPQADEV